MSSDLVHHRNQENRPTTISFLTIFRALTTIRKRKKKKKDEEEERKKEKMWREMTFLQALYHHHFHKPDSNELGGQMVFLADRQSDVTLLFGAWELGLTMSRKTLNGTME